MTVPKPNLSLKYQYICILSGNRGNPEYNTNTLSGTIELFEKQGWTYKGKDLGYPYKLYFEYPKTSFDLTHFAMYEDLGSII